MYASRAILALYRGDDSIDALIAAEHRLEYETYSIAWIKGDIKSRRK